MAQPGWGHLPPLSVQMDLPAPPPSLAMKDPTEIPALSTQPLRSPRAPHQPDTALPGVCKKNRSPPELPVCEQHLRRAPWSPVAGGQTSRSPSSKGPEAAARSSAKLCPGRFAVCLLIRRLGFWTWGQQESLPPRLGWGPERPARSEQGERRPPLSTPLQGRKNTSSPALQSQSRAGGGEAAVVVSSLVPLMGSRGKVKARALGALPARVQDDLSHHPTAGPGPGGHLQGRKPSHQCAEGCKAHLPLVPGPFWVADGHR